MRLARQEQVVGRICNHLGQALKVRRRCVRRRAAFQRGFGKQKARLANRLSIADELGESQCRLGSSPRVNTSLHCQIATTERALRLSLVPLVSAFIGERYRALQIAVGFVQIAAQSA